MIELIAAFALATAAIDFLAATVNGLIVTPINERAGGFDSPLQTGTFTIGHRLFNYEDPLAQLLVVALVLLGVALVARRNHGALFGEGSFTECPYCLAEIPVEATVCASCTRELPKPAAPT